MLTSNKEVMKFLRRCQFQPLADQLAHATNITIIISDLEVLMQPNVEAVKELVYAQIRAALEIGETLH